MLGGLPEGKISWAAGVRPQRLLLELQIRLTRGGGGAQSQNGPERLAGRGRGRGKLTWNKQAGFCVEKGVRRSVSEAA